MTDKEHERMDLQALEVSAADADRVMRTVMARIVSTPQRAPDSLDDVARRAARPVLIAATVLVAAAAAMILFADTRAAPPNASAAMASWAGTGHVPTNEELLLAFEGYSR
jgi:hypothetical protein